MLECYENYLNILIEIKFLRIYYEKPPLGRDDDISSEQCEMISSVNFFNIFIIIIFIVQAVF